MQLPARSRTSGLLAAATIALIIGACGGPPAPSVMTDPSAVLTTAVTNLSQAKSVHVDATAAGSLPISLTGGAATGPGLDLSGTTASADVDLAGNAAHATFAAPGLLGLRGELIAAAGATYLKTTLTGPLYRQQGAPTGAASPAPSRDTAALLKAFQDLLATPGVTPTLGADATCGSATCYTVEVDLTPAQFAALQSATGLELPTQGLPIDIAGIEDSGIHLTAHITKDTDRVAGVTTAIDLNASASPDPAASGTPGADLTVDLTFSKWDEPVSVTPPPADQIAPAG